MMMIIISPFGQLRLWAPTSDARDVSLAWYEDAYVNL
jgi:hypothetical protein